MNIDIKLKYIIVIIVLFGFSSCEDYLIREPEDTVAPGSFWSKPNAPELAMAGMYTQLQQRNLYAEQYRRLDALTDNAYSEAQNGLLLDISRSTHDSGDDFVLRWWASNYIGIAEVNLFLANIGEADRDEDEVRRFKGQAKFLRALFYLNLVSVYGGVPLVLNPLQMSNDISSLSVPRATKEETYNLILQDLDSAIKVLPSRIDVAVKGLANQEAALALKARVFLYKGDFANASKTAALLLDDARGFDLEPDYQELFTVSGERSNEIIFSVQFLSDTGVGQGESFSSVRRAGPNVRGPFEVEQYAPLTNLKDTYEDGDVRLAATILQKGDKHEQDGVMRSYRHTFTASELSVKKYLSNTVTSRRDGGQDFIILRYADVLLMYAEAENEVNGPIALVIEAINEVRSRAGLDSVEDTLTDINKGTVRDLIRHERRVEFAFEGTRYFDLLRWKTIEEAYAKDVNEPSITEDGGIGRAENFKPHNYLWPIPLDEVLKLGLKQNPVYN